MGCVKPSPPEGRLAPSQGILALELTAVPPAGEDGLQKVGDELGVTQVSDAR